MNSFHHDLVAALPKLKTRAINLTRNNSAADDLVQDTIERALRHQATFAPGSNLVAWLLTIMRNCSINQARRAQWCISCDPAGEELSKIAVQPRQDNLVLLGQMNAAVAALPAQQRDAIRLAADGVGAMDLARLQGIAEGTAKSRVSRTRSALRIWAEGAAA